jgi:hypothetical protein
MPELPINYVDTILKLVLSLLVVVLGWVGNRAARVLLRGRVRDTTHLHTLRTLLRNAFFFVCAIVILMIWLGFGSNFTVAMGILGAGIAFASQEVIGSFAGYLNIVSGSIYRIGDRVRINDVVGDVMDISMLRTTVMEIGEWVQADQYTGRIVTVANRAVFSGPVFNYTQHWGYLWDELMLPVTYDSDWRRASEILLSHAQAYSAELHGDALTRLQQMMERYPLQETSVEPSLYLMMTDNWVELSLRYVVRAHERRVVKAQLYHELLQRFESEPRIQVASVTLEVVGMPEVVVRTDAKST